MDILSLIGLVLAIGAILVGQFLEGGHLSSLINGPAALIVIGGTVGAVMLQSSMGTFFHSIRVVFWVVFPPRQSKPKLIERMVSWSNIARKEGLLGLEVVAENEKDKFSQRGLQLLVDGSEPKVIRTVMEVEIGVKEHYDNQAAKVFESMGGYSPTIGILGAVMGLIHVMSNLADPSALGSGIAVAFVATIYGVGFANLFCLPVANKIKSVIHDQVQDMEMVIEGIVSIAEGENPRNIELKLQGYLL